MSENLSLSYEVKHSVLDVLKDIRCSVRTVEVNITLFLANECLVSV
jgi:hypothetical protein